MIQYARWVLLGCNVEIAWNECIANIHIFTLTLTIHCQFLYFRNTSVNTFSNCSCAILRLIRPGAYPKARTHLFKLFLIFKSFNCREEYWGTSMVKTLRWYWGWVKVRWSSCRLNYVSVHYIANWTTIVFRRTHALLRRIAVLQKCFPLVCHSWAVEVRSQVFRGSKV